MWERKRLLIWGTTYPEFSKTYYETVCTGAIDGDTGRLLRIYPITLRHFEEPFGAFDWIDAEIERNTSDVRPESYRINQDSIKIVGHIGTKKSRSTNEWAERSKWMLTAGNVFRSVNALVEARQANHTSLGLVKPKQVIRFRMKYRSPNERDEWEQHREQAIAQKDLFVDVDSKTKDLSFMPVRYYAEFLCEDAACSTTHDMSVLDWGTYVLSRNEWIKKGAEGAKVSVINKLVERMDLNKRDAHFILGNTKAHPDSFMIVGLFAPPKIEPDRQESLF
jgi:hypothetical protein